MTQNSRTNLSFGQAIEALKKGERVARAGWNGKDMFLWLNKGSFDGSPLNITNPIPEDHGSTMEGIRFPLFTVGDVGTVTRLPNINMHTALGSTVTGWLASQTDMLAEDWTSFDSIAPQE